MAASRFRLSHSYEKIHPNDSNIFTKFFRRILENISDMYNFLHLCRRCYISCTACVIVCTSKKFRRCSERISQKYLSRLGGVFQENDSSEIGKPPHNFFPVKRFASNSRFLLRLREMSWVTPAVWGNAREGKRLGCFQVHMHLLPCEHPPPRRVYHGPLILGAALAPVVEKLPSTHACSGRSRRRAAERSKRRRKLEVNGNGPRLHCNHWRVRALRLCMLTPERVPVSCVLKTARPKWKASGKCPF